MLRFDLIPHPDHPPAEVSGVVVTVQDAGRNILLSYRIGGTNRVVVPPLLSSARTDDLWRTTCFELFLMAGRDGRYLEFNFSPSTRWAAYAFDRYRAGMASLPLATPPRVSRSEPGMDDPPSRGCDLDVLLDRADLPAGRTSMALTAVIEEEGGTKSYWALAHPPAGPPDFHHPACFAAILPAPRDS